jgi:hypothetical protein
MDEDVEDAGWLLSAAALHGLVSSDACLPPHLVEDDHHVLCDHLAHHQALCCLRLDACVIARHAEIKELVSQV